MSFRALIVTPDGKVERVDIDGIQALQDAVGGYIELVPTGFPGTAAYVNEDGRRLGLAPNQLASYLVRPDYLWAGPIVGPLVLFGVDGADEVDVPEDVAAQVEALAG
jgi:hypothetical protein